VSVVALSGERDGAEGHRPGSTLRSLARKKRGKRQSSNVTPADGSGGGDHIRDIGRHGQNWSGF
jgi:hypothetical protein